MTLEQKKLKALSLVDSGYSRTEACNEAGISLTTITRFMKQNGREINQAGRFLKITPQIRDAYNDHIVNGLSEVAAAKKC